MPQSDRHSEPLPEFVLEYLRDIAADLVRRFGVTRAEADSRVARAFAHWDFGDPDARNHLGHEFPDYWADWVYHGRSPAPDGD